MNRADPRNQIEQQLKPWLQTLQSPQDAQDAVLHKLLAIYTETAYGRDHNVSEIRDVDDYRQSFPIKTYEQFKPLLEKVMAGETSVLLSEKPIGWAITRGTTKGESKFIPMTPTDMQMRASAGRAMMKFVLDTSGYELFQGVNLNLNFPSRVGTIDAGDRQIEYGYSSGIYTRFVSERTPIRSAPSQDEIDALGGGKTQKDWDQRFELAYEKCRDENVTLVGGVATTALTFGRYLKRTHGIYPRDIWDVHIMTLGSVAGINLHYRPALRALYGDVAIREIYGATEGMFGQQMDSNRAWVPNYDLFLFEVETRDGIKMLHEMRAGEQGSLVVSTPVLPRYKIGDRILAVQPPYYRCIGRDYWWTPLRYYWNEFNTFNFGRL